MRVGRLVFVVVFFKFVSRPPSRPSTSPNKNHRVDKKEFKTTHWSLGIIQLHHRVVKIYRAKNKIKIK